MFNLFRSRDKAVKYLLSAFLMLVALSMLSYLIPNYDMGAVAQGDVIAEVGDERISLLEAQKMVQNYTRGNQVPPALLPTFASQAVDGLIGERVLAHQARRMGFTVSDADIAAAIRATIPSLFPEGKFLGTQAYASMLAQQNYTIEEFEQAMARQILASRVRALALESVFVSPQEIEAEFRKRAAKAKIEWAKIPREHFDKEVQISEEEARKAFDSMQGRYQTRERRDFQIFLIDQQMLAKAMPASEADLRKFYEQEKDRFRTGERVKVRHILFNTAGKTKEEETAIQAKAADVLKQVRAGANFAELAKKHSEDPGSGAKGGDLDWVLRGQMVPEFEQASFSLKPNQIGDLVKTQYGYHIVQVLEKEDARLKPFEEVREQLATEFNQQRFTELMQQVGDKARAVLIKNPPNPEAAARELNAQFLSANDAAANDPLPGGINSPELQNAIFSTPAGEVTYPIQAGPSQLAVARVTEVTPAHAAKYEEVREEVRQGVLGDKQVALLNARAKELAAKAAALGDLRKAVAGMGLEVKTSDEFTRSGAVEGLGSGGALFEAFIKPVGSILGPLEFPDGRVIAKILSRNDPPPAELAAQRESIRQELRDRKARERGALFEESLRKQLIREGEVKVYDDVVKRFTANYRG
jgi:peptidyl-prolyl cis-trans isomerase D